MKSYATEIGRVSRIHLEQFEVYSKEIENEISAIQKEWVEFESTFPSLTGRKLMGLAYGEPGNGTYRLCSTILPTDSAGSITFEIMNVPGGHYLRHRITGEPPALYENIGKAFQHIFSNHFEEVDWKRPTIEYYRSRDVIDCLVPTKSLA